MYLKQNKRYVFCLSSILDGTVFEDVAILLRLRRNCEIASLFANPEFYIIIIYVTLTAKVVGTTTKDSVFEVEFTILVV